MTLSNLHHRPVTRTTWTLRGCVASGPSPENIRLNRFPFMVGRRPDANLVLTSMLVSGTHAEFVSGGNVLFIRDLGSTNGTYHNGRRLEKAVPVANGDRVQFADCEFVIEAASDQQNPFHGTLRGPKVGKQQWDFSRFDELMRGGVYSAYQDIVLAESGDVFGVEALARSDIDGLETPDRMFAASRRVDQEVALSQLCRRVALANCSEHIDELQPLFVNTHPAEDLFEDVLPSLVTVRKRWPDQRLVIELHEEAMTGVELMQTFVDELASLNIEFAYDDFGVGQNRLLEIIEVPPHYIKFDRKLVSGLADGSEPGKQLLRSLVETAHSTGTKTVAEGVEDQATADLCRDLGFDLIQGYLYGRPTRIPRRQLD